MTLDDVLNIFCTSDLQDFVFDFLYLIPAGLVLSLCLWGFGFFLHWFIVTVRTSL